MKHREAMENTLHGENGTSTEVNLWPSNVGPLRFKLLSLYLIPMSNHWMSSALTIMAS